MSRQERGVAFDETLSGGFCLGATDPETGAQRGARQRSRLVIRNRITVTDVDGFYRDPEHSARLEATVDFTPFGNDLPAHTGRFFLLVPSESHRTKLMIYRFGLEYGDEPYFFEGTKYVQGGSSALTFWRDSTTLYSTLHRGTSTDAPIVGAGILQIGLRGNLAMAASMRAIGAASVAEHARTLSRFGRYLSDMYWHAYRP